MVAILLRKLCFLKPLHGTFTPTKTCRTVGDLKFDCLLSELWVAKCLIKTSSEGLIMTGTWQNQVLTELTPTARLWHAHPLTHPPTHPDGVLAMMKINHVRNRRGWVSSGITSMTQIVDTCRQCGGDACVINHNYYAVVIHLYTHYMTNEII